MNKQLYLTLLRAGFKNRSSVFFFTSRLVLWVLKTDCVSGASLCNKTKRFWESKIIILQEAKDKEGAESPSVFCIVQQLRLEKKGLWKTQYQAAAITHHKECKAGTSLTGVSGVPWQAQHFQGGKQHFSGSYGCASVATGYLSGLSKTIPFPYPEMRSSQSSSNVQLPLNLR